MFKGFTELLYYILRSNTGQWAGSSAEQTASADSSVAGALRGLCTGYPGRLAFLRD